MREYIAYLGQTHHLLTHFSAEQARQSILHVIDDLINDAVVTHIDLAFLDGLARHAVGAHVETHDNRLGCQRQVDIRLTDAAYAAGHDLDLNLVG
jgi:alkylated DNA nucleotide flippase Atl1